MILLKGINKYYQTRHGKRVVLNGINLTINAGDKVGILGRNGSGKSTLLNIISGAELPSSGQVIKNMSVSWPIGLSGGLQGTLTGLDNLRFLCRIYDKPFEDRKLKIEEITGLGRYLWEPVATYSSGMKAKLGIGISMLIDFDCYLVDEALSVGDKAFQMKYKDEIDRYRADKALLLVSHHENHIKLHCNKVFILTNGKILEYADIDEAIFLYNKLKRESAMELGF